MQRTARRKKATQYSAPILCVTVPGQPLAKRATVAAVGAWSMAVAAKWCVEEVHGKRLERRATAAVAIVIGVAAAVGYGGVMTQVNEATGV